VRRSPPQTLCAAREQDGVIFVEPWVPNAAPRRPQVVERSEYQPLADQEAFIVPLLKERIEHWLSKFGGSAHDHSQALDVGCGSQPFASAIRRLGYEYSGLDVNQNPEGTVRYICAIDGTLPAEVEDKEFDLVVCLEVLEHVADWGRAFANLALLLAPGGKMLITCPAFYPLHEEPYDFWRPTPHALARFASAAGLQPGGMEMAGGAWDILGTALAAVSARPASNSRASRIAARLADRCRRLAFRCVRSAWPQRLVSLEGPFYLSNVAWFVKPPTGAAQR
jgi:SAM-dependent methyltransferase